MSISESIRVLGREGHSTSEIARRLEIRYQHAYNVLKAANGLASVMRPTSPSSENTAVAAPTSKPPLLVGDLIAGDFVLSGRWVLSDFGDLVLNQALPKTVGVYAFAKDGVAQYVGVATMGLAKRLYFYAKPGSTQRTSQRLNGIIKAELRAGRSVEIYAAFPPDLEWNGLPVHGSAGLELGFVKKHDLPWNMRSAG